jgi:hypothetical protein
LGPAGVQREARDIGWAWMGGQAQVYLRKGNYNLRSCLWLQKSRQGLQGIKGRNRSEMWQ